MNGKVKEWTSTIISFVVILLIAFLLREYVFSPVTVSGHSMDPSLVDREKIIILKTTKIDRFDIVTFPAPDVSEDIYIKRVIGLPGDTVEMKDDQLYINGEKYDEPYLDEYKEMLTNGTLGEAYIYNAQYQSIAEQAEQFTSDFTLETTEGTNGSKVVPEGEYFVLGDNRLISKDSRYIGFIKASDIDGEAKVSYWPISKIGTVE